MATSEINFIYDADSALRAPGSAPVTATGVIGTYVLDKLTNVRDSDQRNTLGAEDYELIFAIESLDTANADETYVFDVVVQGTGGVNPVTVVTFPITAAGKYVMGLNSDTLEKLSAEHDELVLNITVGGTTPSITFAVWVGN